ncbi:hypothetical protein BT67DRAFT_442304 [Trichocladium antarcticum]|uniref:Uncharacterized protein n=1 Tax=Trichocladium antarcticum TaxID=1450529 RepID=A0AAN6UJX9_9PEZI|nr:hypothetical protein BT67DRAFT_442304 [Trichocladium antarcticum]
MLSSATPESRSDAAVPVPLRPFLPFHPLMLPPPALADPLPAPNSDDSRNEFGWRNACGSRPRFPLAFRPDQHQCSWCGTVHMSSPVHISTTHQHTTNNNNK